MRLTAIYTTALPLGVSTVVLARVGANFTVYGTMDPSPEQMNLVSYLTWMTNLLGIYMLLLAAPKVFIYFKGGGLIRYTLLIYLLLPVLAWYFLPGLNLVLTAFCLVADCRLCRGHCGGPSHKALGADQASITRERVRYRSKEPPVLSSGYLLFSLADYVSNF